MTGHFGKEYLNSCVSSFSKAMVGRCLVLKRSIIENFTVQKLMIFPDFTARSIFFVSAKLYIPD